MRRLRTLTRAHRRHQPLTPTLKSYTTVAVRRILKIMQDFSAAQLALSPREHDAILHDVLSQYKSRVGYRQEPHCTALAIAGYVSSLFSLIPFAHILHDPEKESLLARGAFTPVPAFKYDPPLGRALFNTTQIANLTTAELLAISNSPCICLQSQYASLLHPDLGHIITPNIEALCSDPHLQALINLGTKYRALTPSMALYSAALQTEMRDTINRAFTKYARQTEEDIGTANCMQAWLIAVLHDINNAMDAIPINTAVDADMLLTAGPVHTAELTSDTTQRAIRHLRHRFAIT
jgi:hypothetical protein